MLGTDAPPAPRVSAANNALAQLFKVRELHDLEARISELEAKANAAAKR